MYIYIGLGFGSCFTDRMRLAGGWGCPDHLAVCFRIPTPQTLHHAPESRIPNPASRILNPESRIAIPNPESRIPNPDLRSRIPDPESRIPHSKSRNRSFMKLCTSLWCSITPAAVHPHPPTPNHGPLPQMGLCGKCNPRCRKQCHWTSHAYTLQP
jgi:hypothetical protein